jgi:nucleoside-diphosphate-sugar epimerase
MVTRVAVTGAAGRVGRGVLDLLCLQGTSVVAIDCVEPPADSYGDHVAWVQADMTDYEAVVKAFDGCDGLVHLAAVPRPGKLEDHAVHNNNVVGSYNALRAAAQAGINRICQASSINAIGGAWSRSPHYDYLPLDEAHSTFAEDPYSLSKWICEQQGDAMARRYSSVGVASLRFHMVVPGRVQAVAAYGNAPEEVGVKNLWGYTSLAAAAGACWLALDRGVPGHEVFLVVAPEQVGGASSVELAERHYPDVPRRRQLSGDEGFFDCSKAGRLLGWRHEGW